jgi:hypothetical protein
MSIDEYQVDDLDSLIDSIDMKNVGVSGPTQTPEPGADEPKKRDVPLDNFQEIEAHPGSMETPVKKSEPVSEPVKPTKEPPPRPSSPVTEREPEMRMRSPMREPMPSSNRTVIYIVGLFVVAIIFFFMLRRCNSTPTPVTSTSGEETSSSTLEPGTDANQTSTQDRYTPGEKAQPTYDLAGEKLQGTAPLTVKPNGPVASETEDPEIAAVADALKIRIGIIEGSSVKTKDGIITTTSSGTFLGFKISHTLQQRGGEVLKDEIAVTTPSRGQITVKGKILDSMTKITYQTFQNDLKNAGIEVIKNPLPDESIINVQLRLTGSLGPAVNPDFLIGPNSVGSVEIGMPTQKMEALLNRKYSVVSRRLADEDKYYDTFKVLGPGGQPLFFVIGRNGKVIGIQVVSERYKTSRGISIGNKLGEFRVCYVNNGKMAVSSTLAGNPFVSVQGLGIQFFLQGQGLSFTGQVFPDDLKISDILVGSSPFVK